MRLNSRTKFKETELGLIPEDWQVFELESVIDFDPPRKIKKGVAVKFVAMTDLDTFDKRIKSFTKKEFNGGSKFQNGDTLLARITPCLENGKTTFVDILDDDEIAGGSTEFIVLNGKENKADSGYVYYLAISPAFRKTAIQAMVGTSGRQRVQVDKLKSHKVAFPPLTEQQKIAEVLGTLDEKIELNRKMNKTLEQIAQAVFNKWFIEDVDSRWRTVHLGDLVRNVTSGDWGKEYPEGNFDLEALCVRGADIPEIKQSNCGKPPIRFIKNNLEKILVEGDIVIELSGGTATQQTGRSVLITNSIFERFDRPLICSNFCKILRISNKIYTPFFINILNNIYSNDEMYQYESGTTGIKNLNLESLLNSYPILLPTDGILKRFNEVYLDLYKQIQRNGKENQILSQIRDSLLPRLMSGKLRVN